MLPLELINSSNFTNHTLVVSDLLESKYTDVYNTLKDISNKHNINFKELKNTKDIWVRDYFPIQIKDFFVKFIYNPNYLKEYRHLLTEELDLSFLQNRNIKYSDLVIDGGNCVEFNEGVILTDKIYTENKKLGKGEVNSQLKNIFKKEIYVIPKEPYDIIGHSDGMVRIVDDIIFVNDYSMYDVRFQKKLYTILENISTKFNYKLVKLPYTVSNKIISAVGNYVNFIKVGNLIIYPTYGSEVDDTILSIFQTNLKNKEFIGIESKGIAERGGVLNCITSNFCDSHITLLN